MNKNELITFIRNPNSLTDPDLGELEEIVNNNPYFLNGRLLLAKGSKDLKHPETRKRVASAAVYSTDRPLFKKFLSDKLFFLSHPPEEEEISTEVVEEKRASSIDKTLNKSEGIDEVSIPKEEKVQEKTPENSKPRREPRFDPTATASFKRRWDNKSESEESVPKPTEESVPKPTKKSKPLSKVTFSGKKIDRSKRSKKQSIRSEILGESFTESKSSESRTKNVKKEEELNKNKVTSPLPPQSKKPFIDTSKKEELTDRKTSRIVAKEKIQAKPQEEGSKSVIPQKAKKVESQQSKSSPKKVAEKAPLPPSNEKRNLIVEKPVGKDSNTSNLKLNIPQMPSGGIDSILEELKKDMQSLRSSRVKFAEVQQKIEEDDAVSAALERATNKIPLPKETPKEEVQAADHDLHEEQNIDSKVREDIKKEEVEKEEVEKEVVEKEVVEKEVVEKEVVEKEVVEKEVVEKEVKAEKKENKKEEVKEKRVGKEVAKEETKTEKKKIKEGQKDKKEESKEVKDQKVDTPSVKEVKTNLMPRAKKVLPSKKKTDNKEKEPKKVALSKNTAKAKGAEKKLKKEEDRKKEDDQKGKQQKDQDDIIEKFIAETPSIKYQKKSEPTENKDLSDLSTEWNKELASEYLAEIYLHQGNKKRAIEIYTALSLKFPDKKSYFADLISKTK